MLDRLAPRIERAQMLAPETRDAIMQVVDRARVSTGDPRSDMRRSVTLERVTDAIKTRGGGARVEQQRRAGAAAEVAFRASAGKYLASQSRITPQTRALSSANRK